MFHHSDVLPMGRHLGVIAKFGPWASRDTWASVRGASDRFFTHLSDCTIVVIVVFVVVTADPGDVIGEDTASNFKAVICLIHV